jgi:hypothetical protein
MGQRSIRGTERRSAQEFVAQMQAFALRYPEAQVIRVVLDNL